MFTDATWTATDWGGGKHVAEKTPGTLVWIVIGGTWFVVQVFLRDDARPQWALAICFFHCVGLLGCWWPVFFRSRRFSLWIWRFIGLFLLLPWYFVHSVYTDRLKSPPPGPGEIIWAVGSTLICLALWVKAPSLPRVRAPDPEPFRPTISF
jgi:hypothetical protein